jgi:hypothetical protein
MRLFCRSLSMKRVYSSGSKKRAEKARKIQTAVAGKPTINTFLCLSTPGTSNSATAASEDRVPVPEETGVDDEDVPAICSAAPVAPPGIMDAEDSMRAAQIDITSVPSVAASPDSDCDFFKLDRAYPTYRAHFPSTIKLSVLLFSFLLVRDLGYRGGWGPQAQFCQRAPS